MAQLVQRNGQAVPRSLGDTPPSSRRVGGAPAWRLDRAAVAVLACCAMVSMYAVLEKADLFKPPEIRALEKIEGESRRRTLEQDTHEGPHQHFMHKSERLRLAMGEAGDWRIHPQSYVPLEPAAPLPSTQRRSLQTSGTALTTENTQRLKIHVLTDALFADKALPYTTCFKAGQWYKNGFPERVGKATPPTCAPTCDSQGCTITAAAAKYETYVAAARSKGPSHYNPCGGAAGDVYSPSNPNGFFCNRDYDPSGQHCWGICLDRDVLQTANEAGCTESTGKQDGYQMKGDECNMRTWMINRINEYVPEAESYFRSRKRTKNLILQKNQGKFLNQYRYYKANTDAQCAKDAQMQYGLPIPDSYCTQGLDADVILVPVVGLYIPGVAGWGGSAGDDTNGRPLVLVFSWSVPITSKGSTQGSQRYLNGRAHDKHSRGTIIHEIVHGLGFGLSQFRYAYDANGNKITIVREATYTDVSGVRDNKVWDVVSTRTVQVAKDYFNCSTLTSLPLMAENPLGDSQRGSHWETRIMNDEVMSYGEGSFVSPFTVAMMEDLGYYLGNYSAAQCMYWGRGQGCEFVSSRCGIRRNDFTVKFSKSEQCQRKYTYKNAAPRGDSILKAACGDDSKSLQSGSSSTQVGPKCDRQWAGTKKGVSISGVQQMVCDQAECECNAECYSEQGTVPTVGCSQPNGVITAAGAKSTKAAVASFVREIGVPVLCALVLLLFVCGVIHCIKNAKYDYLVYTAYMINILFVLIGFVFLAICIYVYVEHTKYELLIEKKHVLYAMLGGLAALAYSMLGIAAICCATKCESTRCSVHKVLLGLFSLILFCIICVQTLGAFLVFAWVWDSYSITDGTYNSGVTAADRKISTGINMLDDVLDESLTNINGYACNSYVKCCFSSNSSATPCTQTSAASGTSNLDQVLNDPSQPNFCTLATRSKLSWRPPQPVCAALDEIKVVELQKCNAQFCTSGRLGFEAFIERIFEWIREQIIPLGVAIGALGLLEASQLVVMVGLVCLTRDHLVQAQAVVVHKHARARKQLRQVRRGTPVQEDSRGGQHEMRPRRTRAVQPYRNKIDPQASALKDHCESW